MALELVKNRGWVMGGSRGRRGRARRGCSVVPSRTTTPRRSTHTTSDHFAASCIRGRSGRAAAPMPSRSSSPRFPTTSPTTRSDRAPSSPRTSYTWPSESATLRPHLRARAAPRASQPAPRDPLDPAAAHVRRRARARTPEAGPREAHRPSRCSSPRSHGTSTRPSAGEPSRQTSQSAHGRASRCLPTTINSTRGLPSPARQLEVVNVAAAAAVRVEQLVVEDREPDVDGGQPWPSRSSSPSAGSPRTRRP